MIKNVIFKLSTCKVLLFLLSIVILSLAISKWIPFYMKEGLISSTAISSIENALKDYETSVNKICSDGIQSLVKAKMSQAESVTFAPILADEDLKDTSKIDKIIALKSTSEEIKKVIADIHGKKYTTTLTLLNTLNKDTYPEDETFTALLKQQTTSTHGIVSGDNSVYTQLKEYVKTISYLPSK